VVSDVSAGDTPGRVRGADDVVQPFTLESSGVRGRLVRLGPVVDGILSRHAYPEPVARLLGEMVALAGVMAAMLKYDGVFTLQTTGDGPVSMMVVDYMSDGRVRGYADVDGERVPENAVVDDTADARALLGSGQLAYTVDDTGTGERHQGIVELEGQTLAEVFQHYFRQSAQIAAALRLSAGRVVESDGVERWRAGGLMLQQLPEEGATSAGEGEADPEEAWRRAVILMSSVTTGELREPGLTPHELLYRLFNEEGVRVYDPHRLSDACRCSREKVTRLLAGMAPDELTSLQHEDGSMDVTCQFCNRAYEFAEPDVAAIRRGEG